MKSADMKKKGIVDRIWDLFASVRLAVIIFALISITSIAGTLIEQQASPEKNIILLSKIFSVSDAHTVYKVLDRIGLTDMYNSWWFIALLLLFAINIVVCSLDRLPGIIRAIREPLKPLSQEVFDTSENIRRGLIEAEILKAEDAVKEAVKKIGFKLQIEKDLCATQIYGEKGRYGRLGVYVTHISILLVMIGAVIGVKFGFNGSVMLLEGMTSDTIRLNNGRDLQLDFEVRCDDFDVAFYPESERPKSYKSVLSVIENGRDVLKAEIGVNAPLTYKGITFYQSSYGFFPNRDALFKFRITAKNGRAKDVAVKFGQKFDIGGSGFTARVIDFSPALAINSDGELETFAENMINPAALVEFAEKENVRARQWILRNYPQTWETPIGVIEFMDLWGAQYTGLQVRKDPGVWLVYVGCVFMAIGMFMAFFMSHARIWILLRERQGATEFSIIFKSVKNRAGLASRIDKLTHDLKSDKDHISQGEK